MVCFVGISSNVWADETFNDLPGLAWWANAATSARFARADRTGAVGDGDAVGYLSDLSGNGHAAVMGGTVLSGGDDFRPRFIAGAVRDRPGILFDGQNDILSLQNSLIDGASDATLVFTIAGANAYQGNRRIFGAWNADRVAAVGFSATAQPTVSLGLSSGQRLQADDRSSFNFGGMTGNDTVEVMIARFRSGGRLELFGNGRLRATSEPAGNGATINSPQIKLLGNQNALGTANAVQPAQGEGGRFYFLEGLATRSYLSDDQVASVYRRMTRRWQGVQVLEQSPNLQWNIQTNPDRSVAVPDAGHIQGIAVDEARRYVFHTRMIESFNSQWQRQSANIDVFKDVPWTYGEPGHLGDGAVFGSKLLVPIETAQTGQYFGVYDASSADLPLLAVRDVTLPGKPRFGALTIVAEHGTGGVIYAPSYSADGPSKLYRFDFRFGNTANPDFGKLLGSIDLPPSLVAIQGISWQAPYFYFSAALGPGGNRIERIRWNGEGLDNRSETALRAYTTVQGLEMFDGIGYQALQSGAGSEYVFTLENLDFANLGARGEPFDSSKLIPPSSPVLVPEPQTQALAVLLGVCFAAPLVVERRRRRAAAAIAKTNRPGRGPAIGS